MEEILKSINDNLTCIRVKLEDIASKTQDNGTSSSLLPDDVKISKCGFSNRVVHALEGAGITTLGQLRKMTAYDIRDIRNIGSLCMKEIQKVL